MAAKKMARNLLPQIPSRENRRKDSAMYPHNKCTRTLPVSNVRRNGESPFWVSQQDGLPPFLIRLRGRLRWALERLIDAGYVGCTPLNEPGPRWSAYVHELRKLGVAIATITERHSGPFPGTHARYVLRSDVRRAGDG